MSVCLSTTWPFVDRVIQIAADVDYSPVIETVFFGPGETSKTVTVPVTDDDILEDDETFTATLMSDRPNVIVDTDSSNADVTIFDNDRKLSKPLNCVLRNAVFFYQRRCYYWVCEHNL